MDSMVSIFLSRANNELLASEALKQLTDHKKSKEEFGIPADTTFYSAVISHAYYAIFYAAKALLLTAGIKTASPEIHKKTYDSFKHNFIDTGILDVKLLAVYKNLIIRADTLLEIFKDEKWKRGNFTYNTIPQANKAPAESSLKNAKLFVANIAKTLE